MATMIIRLLGAAAAAVLVVSGVASGLAAQQAPIARALSEPWHQIRQVEGIELVRVRDNVYMLVGAGGNVTMQFGEEGVLLVDSGAAGRTASLLAAVRALTTKPLRILINTSSDPDHVSGNAEVVQAAGGIAGPQAGGGAAVARPQNAGIRTIAHENTATRLGRGFGDLPALPIDGVPESTFFTPRKDIFANGEGVQLLAQPAAHTDGDLFVYFRGSDVVSAGDIFLPDAYPRFDPARGGSINGTIDALNTLLELTIPERNQMGGTLVVPGHGRVANEAEVVEYRDMLTIIRDRVQQMIEKGMTLEQIQKTRPTLEYDPSYGTDRNWSGEMFLAAVHRDLSQGR
jgi:glyoxylase-like metal-dependent hydrolase (beta-lactamase superfamily II)